MPPKRFGLTAPIKEQLEAILRDYPGGQLLSEALQNAEDSGASTFELTLDLRTHDRNPTTVSSTGTSQSLDPLLSRPAFVLADNGRGFGDREWAG
jgi:sacsin